VPDLKQQPMFFDAFLRPFKENFRRLIRFPVCKYASLFNISFWYKLCSLFLPKEFSTHYFDD